MQAHLELCIKTLTDARLAVDAAMRACTNEKLYSNVQPQLLAASFSLRAADFNVHDAQAEYEMRKAHLVPRTGK